MTPTPLGATGETNHKGGRMAGYHTWCAVPRSACCMLCCDMMCRATCRLRCAWCAAAGAPLLMPAARLQPSRNVCHTLQVCLPLHLLYRQPGHGGAACRDVQTASQKNSKVACTACRELPDAPAACLLLPKWHSAWPRRNRQLLVVQWWPCWCSGASVADCSPLAAGLAQPLLPSHTYPPLFTPVSHTGPFQGVAVHYGCGLLLGPAPGHACCGERSRRLCMRGPWWRPGWGVAQRPRALSLLGNLGVQ